MTDEPLVVRSIRRGLDALLARDWSTYSNLLADDYRYEDRRALLATSHGKATQLDNARAIADGGVHTIDLDAMEARGERFAVCRLTFRGADSDFVVVVLGVYEVDEEGRYLRSVIFEESQLDEARAELDALAAQEQS